MDLDLDNCGGKMFLRVLLNLAMAEYKPLVSGALKLLFRHFSQRKEVLQAFKQVRKTSNLLLGWDLKSLLYAHEKACLYSFYKQFQVQLLVSSEDIQNYQQIKTDLDDLRLLVEKSELWVYKGRTSSPITVIPRLRKRPSKVGENNENSEELKKDLRMSESSSGQVRFSTIVE